MFRRTFFFLLFILLGVVAGGCSNSSANNPETRPFFVPEYEATTHGRKTWFDRLVEVDPGGLHVDVSPEYLKNPPERVVVLPFSDHGDADFIVNKIPLTFHDDEEKARWAWTDAQRLRRSMVGYLAEREFHVVNTIGIDAVLADHHINNEQELLKVPPERLGEWFGADAVVYGEVTHYEAYYAFLVSAWQVGVTARMVSAHDGNVLWSADGSRYDVALMPAIDIPDIAINSAMTLLQLRDVNLARSEEEVCREVVLRVPVSDKLRDRIAAQARDRAAESEHAQAPTQSLVTGN